MIAHADAQGYIAARKVRHFAVLWRHRLHMAQDMKGVARRAESRENPLVEVTVGFSLVYAKLRLAAVARDPAQHSV